MKLSHSQANRSRRTPWIVPSLCAMLLSIPTHAIEVRIDPPPSSTKTFRGLSGLFHRVSKEPKGAADQARSSLGQGLQTTRNAPGVSSQPMVRILDPASRSRRVASYRQQDAVTLDQVKPATQPPKKIERVKPSRTSGDEPASPAATESATSTDSTSANAQMEAASTSPAAPLPVATVAFARPVPGKKGLVYPPGAEESHDTEVDVSELQPGQLARDPRTGNIFRVP